MTTEDWVHALPGINASLNGVATLLLTAGFTLIVTNRERYWKLHRNFMVGAFAVSVVFLACYLLHKGLRASLGGEINTTFAGEGVWAWIYYPMLITHIILAMVIVPLIFVTFFHAFRRKFDKHRKWARWTFPLWYYVSITGVLVYFFLYVWFPGES